MAIGKIDKTNIRETSAQRERVENARAEQITPGADKPKVPARNQKVDEVSKLYEKQFLREMVKAMRGSGELGYMKPSMGEKIYREELDNQYVESWGDQGGVGLQKLIYDQLMERYFENSPGLRSLKAKGMMKLTDKDISHITPLQTEQKSQMPLKIELKENRDGTPTRVQLPWDAKFISQSKMHDGKTAVNLEHQGGFKSTFIFDGVFSAQAKNSELKQGASIATLSPEIKSFFWNLTGPIVGAPGPQDSTKYGLAGATQNVEPDKDQEP